MLEVDSDYITCWAVKLAKVKISNDAVKAMEELEKRVMEIDSEDPFCKEGGWQKE